MLTEDEKQRYKAHLSLPGVGEAGQDRLSRSKVLIIGAGGLGSPATAYLAAAGVGTLFLADDDVVDTSNLQRQILYRTEQIGQSKTDCARAFVQALNPKTAVQSVGRVRRDNVLDLLNAVDVVIDGCDNLATRRLVDDAAEVTNTPVVYGSVYRFEGQVSVFNYHNRVRYKDLFPPSASAPSCTDAGVLGAVVGVVGTIQATTALQILMGHDVPLDGQLMLIDTTTMRFEQLALRRGKLLAVTKMPQPDPFLITVDQLKDHLSRVSAVIDLRTEQEAITGQIPGTTDRVLPTAVIEHFSRPTTVIVYCQSGQRSSRVAIKMRADGHTVYDVEGGMNAWRRFAEDN